MKSNNYKAKFYIAVPVMLLICLIAWFGPINQTLRLNEDLKKINNEIEKLDEAPQRIIKLQERLKIINDSFGINDSIKISQQLAFVKLSEVCIKNKVSIREVPDLHVYKAENIIINTYSFCIEGTFVSILKSLSDFEKDLNILKIVSISYNKVVDIKTKTPKLIADIKIQSLQKVIN